MKRLALMSLASVLALSTTVGLAQTAQQNQQPAAKKAQQIYGSRLMTQDERNAYRDRMRGAKTQQEREQVRTEHHSAMQARAKERGVTLPDAPRARRSGQGGGPAVGQGAGKGMGPRMAPDGVPGTGPGMGRGPGGGAGPGPGYGPGMGGGPGAGAGAK